MNEQGCSRFGVCDNKSDRIAGLEKVISPSDIAATLVASSKVDSRQCMLTHQVMMWVELAMGLFTDMPIRQVYKTRLRGEGPLPRVHD